jgi:peptidoglycan/LPS O-acetylase OafA/YrhL
LEIKVPLQGIATFEPKLLPIEKKTGYLPTLDGWRAIAILGVIFTHDTLHSFGPFSTGWVFENGGSGVELFFAISGLLICWRLLEEEQLVGRISLRKFYLRRAFRILPPALAYLSVIGVLAFVGVLHIGMREWLGAALFFRNYTSLLGQIGPDSYFTAHFWSLAVEEHFYLVLPALLVLTKNRWRVPILLGVALLVEAHRMLVLETKPWDYVLFHTDIRLDALMIPAVFAVLVQSRTTREKMKKWLRAWPLLLIGAVILVTNWEGKFWETVLVVVLLPMTVLGTVLNPYQHLALVLEWAPLRYIGRISYSLYLWQQLFITGHFYAIRYPLGILESTPLRFVAMFSMAIASYHLLERPLIKLGHHLAPPATPGRDDMADVQPDAERPKETVLPQVETSAQ